MKPRGQTPGNTPGNAQGRPHRWRLRHLLGLLISGGGVAILLNEAMQVLR
jgi:hypothetical protein